MRRCTCSPVSSFCEPSPEKRSSRDLSRRARPCTYPPSSSTRSRRWWIAMSSRPPRPSWTTSCASRTATEEAEHASDHPPCRQGHPPSASHPSYAEAAAEGGWTASDGLGDGPAQGAGCDGADLHHRPLEGAGGGVCPCALQDSVPLHRAEG